MKTIAILDSDKVLIGFKKVKTIKQEDVEVPNDCDLNTNRKYKWIETTFMPIGFGHKKPKPLRNGLTREHAFYLLMKAVVEGKQPPAECKEWVQHYEENFKKRNEEGLKKKGVV